ncbi:MAG: TonB-dependent receptor [Gammaproteobacteria bacterium]|nr:TonB-dependent receptor [Gammaproteobacteria bacterium]MCY4210176.1 TonB-dependent receptor [Gammaproteobacteria bacterium]MCY4282443.1 TonB-dependent receptor [Gammaproteobacteria bacterium]MCY4338357.1 TonB-dependent receptor [Gammaproteobacteria bacterium]
MVHNRIMSYVQLPWLFLSGLLVAGQLQAQVIEEIIVTATKRETALQDTAISISALSEFQLQRLGAEGIFDYGVKIPNLGFSNEADGRFNASSPAIRGVAGGGVVGATGFYIDDIPVPEYMNPRVADISRVEVLRGPQGTLYGARSMGGTVRVITKQANPGEFDGYLHATVSDVKEGDVNYAVDSGANIPLADNMALRAMGYYAANSGVFDRMHLSNSSRPAFADRTNVDDDSYYGTSLALTWQVNDALTIRPRFMYQRTESDNLPLADLEPGNFTVIRANDIKEPGDEEWWLGSVTINLDTGIGEIVSTTAKYDRKVEEFEDQTGTLDGLVFAGSGLAQPNIPSFLSELEEDTSFIHETRLNADFGDLFSDRIAATVGVFYEDREHIREYPPSFAPGINEVFTSALNAAAGLEIPFPPGALGTDQVFSTYDDVDTEEIALFGEVTFKLTDRLRFTAGARWSDVDVKSTSVSDGFVNSGPSMVDATQSESSVNPKFLLEADMTDDILVYASAAKGFRIGGNNFNVPFSPVIGCLAELETLGATSREDVDSFNSDSIWSYELGTKTAWFDNRLTLNVAGFFIDWSDIIQTNRLACGFQVVANAGEAESKGFEIELEAAPAEGLYLSAGFGYTDAEITAGDNPISGLAKGDRVNQVPEVTFNATAEYTFPLFTNWEGYVRGDFSHYGDSLSANNNATMPRVRPSFEILNLRLGMFQAGNWDLSLFVKNATNEHANLSDNRSIAAEKPGRPRIVTNRPRSIGLEVRKDF